MKNIKKTFVILVGLSSLSLCGCIATQDDVGILKTQVAALNKTLSDLQKNQASSSQQMEEFTVRLSQATDNLENFDYKLDAISSKIDNLSSSLNNKESFKIPPSEIFENAQKQFEESKFEESKTGFNLYLKEAVDGQNADVAYLRLAQINIELKDYQSSALAAATLLEKFPSSKHIAAARVLYARSIIPLGKTAEAQTYLKSVVQDFKGSPQAIEAQKLLKSTDFKKGKQLK